MGREVSVVTVARARADYRGGSGNHGCGSSTEHVNVAEAISDDVASWSQIDLSSNACTPTRISAGNR
jgi:hypothetical protein